MTTNVAKISLELEADEAISKANEFIEVMSKLNNELMRTSEILQKLGLGGANIEKVVNHLDW